MHVNRSGAIRLPPISSDREQRLKNAIHYYDDLKLPKLKAAAMAHVSRPTLDR